MLRGRRQVRRYQQTLYGTNRWEEELEERQDGPGVMYYAFAVLQVCKFW